jgi:hypothetical protein
MVKIWRMPLDLKLERCTLQEYGRHGLVFRMCYRYRSIVIATKQVMRLALLEKINLEFKSLRLQLTQESKG